MVGKIVVALWVCIQYVGGTWSEWCVYLGDEGRGGGYF